MTVQIDLWTWPLDVDAAERARLSAFLSDDEKARAARFVFERDRERYIVAHGRLREILGGRANAHPNTLHFEHSDQGKPALVPRAFHFNLSHSDGLAALAVSADFALGVDVEAVRPLKEDVAERFFSRREVEALARLSPDDQLHGFYRCWTRKEAVIKAIGEGLSRPLDSFDVSVEAGVSPTLERLDGEADAPQRWRLAHFDPAPGFVGAVACRTGGAALVLKRH
jgi:4'-phosphopantetheinyl transferase